MTNMPFPTVYASLLEYGTGGIIDDLNRSTSELFRRAESGVTQFFVEQMRRAYVAGVQDGFVQGVQAEADHRVSQHIDEDDGA